MNSPERIRMIAPCGIDCGVCEMHMCGDNPHLHEYFISKGYPKEKIPCSGCRNVDGKCPVIGEPCATYSCSKSKGIDYCYECADFPCAMFNPAADRAEILPHNLKVFNLCVVKNRGIDEFIKEYPSIKAKYYKGKMKVGIGPEM
jgi:hypothetical protein